MFRPMWVLKANEEMNLLGGAVNPRETMFNRSSGVMEPGSPSTYGANAKKRTPMDLSCIRAAWLCKRPVSGPSEEGAAEGQVPGWT